MITQLMPTGYDGTRRQDCPLDLAWPLTNAPILHRPTKTNMTHRDQHVRLLRFISSTVGDDRYEVRTIEGERRGEKVLLPGMNREWTEDLLEG